MAPQPPDREAAQPRGKDESAAAKTSVLEKFTPEEEASLLDESKAHKAAGNDLYLAKKYNAAINKYEEAAAVLPPYLEYELAVLRSNMATCHLNLQEWAEAIKQATAAIDGLAYLEQVEKEADEARQAAKDKEEDVEDVIVSAGASKAGPALQPEEDTAEAARRKRRGDIAKIRVKSLLRRARARRELGGWSNLEGAMEDYKTLSTMPNVSPTDQKSVAAQLRELPPKIKAAQEKETAEMWAKLKDLGNGLLKPFGLSTDQFKMVQDEKTGGYSMSFGQGGSSEKK